MKHLTIILILLNLFVYINTYAQGITQEEKEMYIQILADSASYDQFYALFAVIDSNIVEAKDIIEQKFWQYSRFDQTLALKALLKFQSNLTLEYAHRLIDTLEINPDDHNLVGSGHAPDILSEKVEISNVLFELNDFSQIDFVCELIERDSIKQVQSIVIEPLIKIMQNVPSHSENAKNTLVDLIYNSNDQFTRLNALIGLEKAIGIDALPVILQAFQQDSSDVNRYHILNQYFSKYSGDFNLEEVLRERLYSEPIGSLRLRISKILLYGPGGISNYNFIKNYVNNEPDEMIKDLMDLEIKQKIPRLFDEESTIDVIIDSLISVTNQVLDLNWLGDLTYKDYLQSIIQSAKTKILAEDSLYCAVKVRVFQHNVDNVYKDSLNADPRFVTMEGWKFLYWNAQYILDRLPAVPLVPDMEEVIPSLTTPNNSGFTLRVKGANFTINSVIYWNGTVKQTNYLSDSLLSVEINPGEVSSPGIIPVWIKEEGLINTDTLEFRIVNSLPASVEPVVECVRKNSDGSYTAYFGYINNNNESVFIPVSSHNKISPSPWDRGQPGVFLVGRVENVFTVDFTRGNIIWHLNNRIAKANKKTVSCP